MAKKMVHNFRRSLSFPNHPSSSSSSKPKKNFHVRSTSLPCRSHPLISQLKDEINELKSFINNPEIIRSSSSLCECLSRLKIVHESLDDLLQLPQTRETLSNHVELTEKLLEDFLTFVDVYGMFQTLILTLKEDHLTAVVAVRRKDELKMCLYVKGLKKFGKEMDKLISTMQCNVKAAVTTVVEKTAAYGGDNDVVEVCEAMKLVVEVTNLVSLSLFNGLSISLPSRKSTWMGLALPKKAKKKVKIEDGIQEFLEFGYDNLMGLKKKEENEVKFVLKKMHDLEDCIVGIESCSEKVFRSLINARVSLLNVLT